MISVVLPVLNADHDYFMQTINSLRSQSFQEFEVLVIEDPGERTVDKMLARINDQRFRLIKNSVAKGFAGQLNLGLKLARFDYIARIDADDVAAPERFARQLSALQSNTGLSLVGSFLRLIDEHGQFLGERKYPVSHDEIRKKAVFCSPVAHPAVMFRKNDILRQGGYLDEFGLTADYDLWARLLCAGRLFYNLPENLTEYRIHTRASKFTSLRRTLSATIAIKKRHFQHREYWNFLAQLRLTSETMLLRLPPALVYRAFQLLLKRGLP